MKQKKLLLSCLFFGILYSGIASATEIWSIDDFTLPQYHWVGQWIQISGNQYKAVEHLGSTTVERDVTIDRAGEQIHAYSTWQSNGDLCFFYGTLKGEKHNLASGEYFCRGGQGSTGSWSATIADAAVTNAENNK